VAEWFRVAVLKFVAGCPDPYRRVCQRIVLANDSAVLVCLRAFQLLFVLPMALKTADAMEMFARLAGITEPSADMMTEVCRVSTQAFWRQSAVDPGDE
jgi:hypothetical protein